MGRRDQVCYGNCQGEDFHFSIFLTSILVWFCTAGGAFIFTFSLIFYSHIVLCCVCLTSSFILPHFNSSLIFSHPLPNHVSCTDPTRDSAPTQFMYIAFASIPTTSSLLNKAKIPLGPRTGDHTLLIFKRWGRTGPCHHRYSYCVLQMVLNLCWYAQLQIAYLPHYSSGQTYYYPAFNAMRLEDALKFAHEFGEVLVMPIVLEAVMHVRISRGAFSYLNFF